MQMFKGKADSDWSSRMTSECSHLTHNKTLVNSVLGVKQTTSDNYVVHWKTIFNKEIFRSFYLPNDEQCSDVIGQSGLLLYKKTNGGGHTFLSLLKG